MAHSTFRLPTGRQLGISATGDPLADRLVIFFHPTPGAGVFDPDPVLTGSWGVHILAIDRPGYGGSTPYPQSQPVTFSRYADDVAEYLLSAEGMARSIEGVNYGPVGVIGSSTGCLAGLHLAAQYPDLVDKVVLIDPPRPARTLDTAARTLGLAPSVVDAIGRSRPVPPDTLKSFIGDLTPTSDAEERRWELYPGVQHRLQRMVDAAEVEGSDGIAGDLQAVAEPGADTPARTVAAPTLILHSGPRRSRNGKDARWYGRRLPHSDLCPAPPGTVPAIVTAWEQILAYVAPHHGDIPPQNR